MQRVNIYVDGFNFYFGLKSKSWKKYYWLDIVKFFEQFIKPDQVLQNVFYFTAVPKNDGKKIGRIFSLAPIKRIQSLN